MTLRNLWYVARAPDLERQAASARLLLPLRPEWVHERIGVTRQTYNRWVKVGIPEERFGDVLEAARSALFGAHEEAASPFYWARRLMADARSLSDALGVEEAAERVAELAGDEAPSRPVDGDAQAPGASSGPGMSAR